LINFLVSPSTKERIPVFGEVKNTEMILNHYGRIIENNLKKIEDIHKNIELDYYVIMPDHIHLIIIIDSTEKKFESRSKMLLSRVLQQFKRACTIDLSNAGFLGVLWQRSYYDRIIRNEREMYFIRNYIKNNPLAYQIEKGFPENIEL
jgi:putative transposase